MNTKTTIDSANDFAQNYDDYIQNCHWVGTDILFGFTYEGMSDSEDDYKESSIAGLFERHNLHSGIKVFRHTDKYIFELMETNEFQLLKKTEFLAFVDSNTKAKIYFNVVIAKRK